MAMMMSRGGMMLVVVLTILAAMVATVESFQSQRLTMTPRPQRDSVRWMAVQFPSETTSLAGVDTTKEPTTATPPIITNQRVFLQRVGLLAAVAVAQQNADLLANVLQDDAVLVLGQSLLALVASVVAVSAGTAVLEATLSVPVYDSSSQRFDQTHFSGRFGQMLLQCDPRLLLYSEEQVRAADDLAYGSMDPTVSDRELWEAKRIADSALHPDTGDWIPRAFRMSGYLPFNGPICVAMILADSTGALLFWSWLNQSQNALVNYYNSASSSRNILALLPSYGAAVGAALAVAWGLSTAIPHYCHDADQAAQCLKFISFPSAVLASSLNCYIVRHGEIETGVPLHANPSLDEASTVLPLETSSKAAKRGVVATTASRAVLQLPTYFFPPLLLESVAPLRNILVEHPSVTVPLTTFLLLVCFGVGLPAAVGMFSQVAKVSVQDVEDKYQQLGYDEFYYNKGL